MLIFIPTFIVLFIVVPWLLTKMAADLLGIRQWRPWLVLFAVIAALNWQMWQAPKPAPVHQVAGRGSAP